jgi:rod shape-determining protein MreD
VRAAAVDLVLVAVVYVALTTGPVSGMLSGSVAGLIQDALSSGVIGIGGLAKSLVGFLVGAIGQQFIVTAALPRLVIFLGATALHAAVFMGLYVALGKGVFPSPWKAIATQALGNAVVGMVGFAIVESLPGALERRRGRRRGR